MDRCACGFLSPLSGKNRTMKKNETYIAHYRDSDDGAQTVEQHLVATANLARLFAGKIGLPTIGEIMGLTHDVGKYSQAFQNYIKSAEGKINPDEDEYVDAARLRGHIDHSTAGAQLIWRYLKEEGNLQKLLAQVLALCGASHHSGLLDCLAPDGTDIFTKRMEKRSEQTHLYEIEDKIDEVIENRLQKLLKDNDVHEELRICLQKVMGGKSSCLIREFNIGILARFLFSCLIDADRLDSANRCKPNTPEWDLLIDILEKHITSFQTINVVDEVRVKVSAACKAHAAQKKGLYQLTVPTGGGKTLASLRFALSHAKEHEMDRIIYVVPYTSIIDQNAEVVRKIYKSVENESTQVILEHHSNLTPEHDTWQSKVLSENWDAPIIFTTAVQFLETLFASGTRGVRRMHQLANAIIIFDEVQTIPLKTVHLFNNAINFLVDNCGSTVVFCTATQPLLNKVDNQKGAAKYDKEHEIMPDIHGLFKDLQRVAVKDKRKAGGWSDDEIAEQAIKETKSAGSVLVIVNTKKAAQKIYQLCKAKEQNVYHLSTNMCPAHRIDILNTVKACLDINNPKPVICISTQLIEAGVDIDFGAVIRYLAGLDSIAQAAGRCNRNGLRKTGEVIIINPINESLSNLPEIRKAKDIAEKVLGEYHKNPVIFDNDLLSPKTMERYYKYYFFDQANIMSFNVSARAIGHDDDLLTMLSTNGSAVQNYIQAKGQAPPINLRQSFKTAAEEFKVIDMPTEGIVVPYGDGEKMIGELCAAFEVKTRFDLLRRAQRYSVNIYPQDMRRLMEANGIYEAQAGTGIYCLKAENYSNEYGISLEKTQDMKFQNA